MQQFKLGKDTSGFVTYDIDLPDPGDLSNTWRCALAASTEKTLTVPDNANSMLLTTVPGAPIVVGTGSVALTAATANFTNLNGHISPVKRFVKPGQTVRFYNLDTTDAYEISVTFYNLDNFNG